MSVPTENLTLCEPVSLDLWLRYEVDHSDVHRALVALGDDILDMLPIVYRFGDVL